MMTPRRAVILDRDGVINRDHGYVYRPHECDFMDGIFPLLRLFTAYGFTLVIATNQSGIGRGLYDERDFQTFMTWMKQAMAGEGIVIDAIYHCPDHPTAGVGPYRRDNPWRKPAPGMFLAALADGDYAAEHCWSIGDRASDLAAARAARIGTRILLDPQTTIPVLHPDGHWSVPHLRAISPLLGAHERVRPQ